MHGRLKVKTTEEQAEARRKEREKKAQLYSAGTQKAFQKRAAGEFDSESLEVTSQLLSANPDFYTLWNFRKEIFHFMKEEKEPDVFQGLCENELFFLQQCLQTNPKSYGSWHHRCWVMDNMPQPDWKKELHLCNRYLELDERNFHCWDYRRFVVQRSGVPTSEEFDFTTTKISNNFSNFSSWHYRSKLLPQLYPDTTQAVGVQEEKLLEEFELVQNAFFTDPSDQSAWFYHRWLLGRGQQPLGIQSIRVCRKSSHVVVLLNKPAKVGADVTLMLSVNGKRVSILISTFATHEKLQYSQLWICKVQQSAFPSEADCDISVTLASADDSPISRSCTLKAGDMAASWLEDCKKETRFNRELSSAKSAILTQELESCQQLHELEPDNKWTLLTIVSLMRAVDPLKYEAETLQYLSKLIEVDPMRISYYTDLRSKFLMENAIETQIEDNRTFSLTNKDLSMAYHLDHLMTMETIDLSHNSLLHIDNGHLLHSVVMLNLDSNRVNNLSGFQYMDNLETISVKNNDLQSTSDLEPLTKFSNLKTVFLQGNPLCTDANISDISSLLPGVEVVL